MSTPTIARSELDLSLVVTSLMKGVVYADTHARVWQHLLGLQPRVRDFMATMGLAVIVDEAEGYAYLRQREEDEVDQARPAIPRLVPRRSLSFPVSLLLALLRRRMAEFDASDAGVVLVITREQIVAMLEVFLPSGSSEARMVDQIDGHIGKVVDLGFLRPVKDSPVQDAGGTYEVRRILKAFVDAQWLASLDTELRRYAVQVGAIPPDEDADQGEASQDESQQKDQP